MNQKLYKYKFLYVALFLVFFTLSESVLGQSGGKLAGRITDEKGEELIGANVIVVGTDQGAASDMQGYYSILNLKPGTYSVSYKYIGYQTQTVTNIRISTDKTTTIDVKLGEEVLTGQEVIVVAQKPLVEYNETSSVISIGKDDIKNLPVQSLDEIVNLQAGVVDGHFRGGRIGEVQYQVDGVSVNNPFNNASSLSLDRSIIEEVQIISGTFDAKYGQAMSGVVNAVLKSGGSDFEYSGELYGGDYFTTDTKRYPNTDSYTPYRIINGQLTLSGPTGLPQTTFFISGRKYMSDGYLYAVRRFNPTDKSDFQTPVFNPTGDNELVPMTTNDEWSGQFKINNKSIKSIEVSYQATLNYGQRTSYNHAFALNPDGINNNYTTSLTHGFGFTHTLNDHLFYKVNIRQNYFDYSDYKYKDLYDPRYLAAGAPKGDANYENGAIIQGVDLGRYNQKTNTYIAKAEITWQAERSHMLEGGLEWQYSEITFGSPGFFVTTNVGGVEILQPREEFPRVPGLQNYYPIQSAAYIQDRIELGDLVVRAGVRFEFFNAKSIIPSDFQNPANTITGAPLSVLVKTKNKVSLAPRAGFSFPLTASSSVYFSYGHFYQLPALGLLYSNANYSLLDELQAGGISYGVMGNPDLEPEFTIQYECGYKQAFGNIFGSELSFFYKDIRDLLGVEFVSTYAAADYGKFTNVDFGSVYGFTLSLSQKNYGNFSTSFDYTLQFAQGNSSDPRETANRAASGKDPRPRTIPFGWDQANTLNASIVYFLPENFSCSALMRFGSGQPYTPEIGTGFGADLETNSGRKDSYFLMDLRAEKYFSIDKLAFSVYARAFNIFNAHSVNGFVFNSTGSPDYTLNPAAARSVLTDPSRFYEPRRIEIGISFRSIK